MKLFKAVDDKLADIGFVKIKEDKYGAWKYLCWTYWI